jgi:hypothetical protein
VRSTYETQANAVRFTAIKYFNTKTPQIRRIKHDCGESNTQASKRSN